MLGCDQGTRNLSDGNKGPAPQVVWKYPWTYTDTDPVGVEAIKVPTLTSIRVQFDRFLLPNSAVRQSICIQAATVGGSNTPNDQCAGGNISPEYDPVDRIAVWKSVSLLPNQRYNVRLLVAKSDDDPNGIRAFDGVPLAEEYRFAFTTGDGTPAGTDPSFVEPNRSVNLCSSGTYCSVPNGCGTPPSNPVTPGPQGLLDVSCSGGADCHGPRQKSKAAGIAGSALLLKEAPTGGVPAAVQRLVSQSTVATETAVGPDPTAPRRGPLDKFGVNMPYIDANNPGNSYLLYKAILGMPPRCGHTNEESANPHLADSACQSEYPVPNMYSCKSITCVADAATPAADAAVPPPMTPLPPIVPPWVPDKQWRAPVQGEYARLRSRIRGDAMPPNDLAPTPHQSVSAISAWIAAGALTTCSP